MIILRVFLGVNLPFSVEGRTHMQVVESQIPIDDDISEDMTQTKRVAVEQEKQRHEEAIKPTKNEGDELSEEQQDKSDDQMHEPTEDQLHQASTGLHQQIAELSSDFSKVVGNTKESLKQAVIGSDGHVESSLTDNTSDNASDNTSDSIVKSSDLDSQSQIEHSESSPKKDVQKAHDDYWSGLTNDTSFAGESYNTSDFLWANASGDSDVAFGFVNASGMTEASKSGETSFDNHTSGVESTSVPTQRELSLMESELTESDTEPTEHMGGMDDAEEMDSDTESHSESGDPDTESHPTHGLLPTNDNVQDTKNMEGESLSMMSTNETMDMLLEWGRKSGNPWDASTKGILTHDQATTPVWWTTRFEDTIHISCKTGEALVLFEYEYLDRELGSNFRADCRRIKLPADLPANTLIVDDCSWKGRTDLDRAWNLADKEWINPKNQFIAGVMSGSASREVALRLPRWFMFNVCTFNSCVSLVDRGQLSKWLGSQYRFFSIKPGLDQFINNIETWNRNETPYIPKERLWSAQYGKWRIDKQDCTLSIGDWSRECPSCLTSKTDPEVNRTRTITETKPAKCGGICKKPAKEESCKKPTKLCHCQFTEWSSWSSCSASCGKGKRSHTRQRDSFPFVDCIDPVLEEKEDCRGAEQFCPCGEWTPWSECSTDQSCGRGSRTRTRVPHPDEDPAKCPATKSETEACYSSKGFCECPLKQGNGDEAFSPYFSTCYTAKEWRKKHKHDINMLIANSGEEHDSPEPPANGGGSGGKGAANADIEAEPDAPADMNPPEANQPVISRVSSSLIQRRTKMMKRNKKSLQSEKVLNAVDNGEEEANDDESADGDDGSDEKTKDFTPSKEIKEGDCFQVRKRLYDDTHFTPSDGTNAAYLLVKRIKSRLGPKQEDIWDLHEDNSSEEMDTLDSLEDGEEGLVAMTSTKAESNAETTRAADDTSDGTDDVAEDGTDDVAEDGADNAAEDGAEGGAEDGTDGAADTIDGMSDSSANDGADQDASGGPQVDGIAASFLQTEELDSNQLDSNPEKARLLRNEEGKAKPSPSIAKSAIGSGKEHRKNAKKPHKKSKESRKAARTVPVAQESVAQGASPTSGGKEKCQKVHPDLRLDKITCKCPAVDDKGGEGVKRSNRKSVRKPSSNDHDEESGTDQMILVGAGAVIVLLLGMIVFQRKSAPPPAQGRGNRNRSGRNPEGVTYLDDDWDGYASD